MQKNGCFDHQGRSPMPLHLFHYTDKNGYDAILHTKKLLPSTKEGKAHTHFGKGIYFGDLDPIFDARYLGLDEIAATLFNRLSANNFEKFFYYFELRFPDGFSPMPRPVVVNDDKKAGFTYVNKSLYLLETEEPLFLSERAPAPGVVQLVAHGLTYWGQVRDLGSSDQEIWTMEPGWKTCQERHRR
ncbi:hypothetical protein OOT46_20045 [Aquabacterium sp. A7-Y]|uniref:hypothetical protein n=1 Tax=Aquabacterium sp. A7-Y TaxID=1349605 RepID=UPI00223D33B4|nr:hypothetical protein [Aquabacterium sp. A7-Y]MCW7540129.1 hypothetical protein [Aquabacterium sp. A7-Y]